ncbi:MAG TPA: alpha/beta hydrolase [Steroidobacteraceae bacterium]|nr:alpha/beta hydrolase [Steroidobacteraceae bacterium]
MAWVVCASSAVAALPAAAQPLELEACRLEHPLELASVAARCGILKVAEDPSRASGRRIGLRIAVIPALNRRARAAPLFILAGGPGQAASDLYVSTAGAFARVNLTHDIVLVDQRGTGGSEPIVCSYPDDWRETADELPALRQATLACLARYGERVRYYTTSVAVLDLEQARRALGYAQIELYGASYGTRVAELYMRHHPQLVRAAILDGVTDPQQPIGPDTPLDGERALDLILERCALSPQCAAAYPDLRRDFSTLRASYGPETQALTLSDPSTGEPLALDFNRSVLAAALRLLSYSSSEAALLPSLIHQAAAGRLAPLAAQPVMLAREIRDQIATGMQNSVVCSEDVPFFAPMSAEQRHRIEATYQGSEQLDALAEICRVWPRGPVDADLHEPLHSAVPTLLLSGEADPVTPPAGAERVARGLLRYRHLVLRGEGHGQVATGCVPRIMAAFLESADPQALDAACLQRQRPAPFFTAMTGPAP